MTWQSWRVSCTKLPQSTHALWPPSWHLLSFLIWMRWGQPTSPGHFCPVRAFIVLRGERWWKVKPALGFDEVAAGGISLKKLPTSEPVGPEGLASKVPGMEAASWVLYWICLSRFKNPLIYLQGMFWLYFKKSLGEVGLSVQLNLPSVFHSPPRSSCFLFLSCFLSFHPVFFLLLALSFFYFFTVLLILGSLFISVCRGFSLGYINIYINSK